MKPVPDGFPDRPVYTDSNIYLPYKRFARHLITRQWVYYIILFMKPLGPDAYTYIYIYIYVI